MAPKKKLYSVSRSWLSKVDFLDCNRDKLYMYTCVMCVWRYIKNHHTHNIKDKIRAPFYWSVMDTLVVQSLDSPSTLENQYFLRYSPSPIHTWLHFTVKHQTDVTLFIGNIRMLSRAGGLKCNISFDMLNCDYDVHFVKRSLSKNWIAYFQNWIAYFQAI